MSLDKIKETVIAAATAKAEALLADAGKEAERHAADRKAIDERVAAETIRDAKIRFERETTRELERLQYENRLEVLAAKNTAIAEVFKRVKDALGSMSDDDYVGMVGKWLAALPAEVGGTLRVNPKDEGKFTDRLTALNKGRKGEGKFAKVEADPKVSSGAVLDGPDYTIDCTVERRLDELRESSLGDLAKALFGA